MEPIGPLRRLVVMTEVDRCDEEDAVRVRGPDGGREGSASCRPADVMSSEARPPDPVPFSVFYAEHRNRLASAVALTVRNHTLGAEAVDEAMARAYADWARVSRMSNPSGWVYRVGMNWTRSLLRRRRREGLGVDTEWLARRDDHVDVDLERALRKLSVDHRAVVVARYLLGFSTSDTALALGISDGTVKSRLSRALDQLRAELEHTNA